MARNTERHIAAWQLYSDCIVIHTINIRSLSLYKYPLTMKIFYLLLLPIITFTACSSPATSTPGKMDSTYNRDIKIITRDGKFLIADIVEYN